MTGTVFDNKSSLTTIESVNKSPPVSTFLEILSFLTSEESANKSDSLGLFLDKSSIL